MSIVGALQQPPQERLNGHGLEVLPAHFVSPDRPRDAVGLQAKILDAMRGNSRKYRVLVAHIAHFRIGKNRKAKIGGLKLH
jgi:hypothetical protein